MKFPSHCRKCGWKWNGEHGEPESTYTIIRSELDFHCDEPDRTEDVIYECNHCHTLYRAYFELKEFVRLAEVMP